jgi:uncharacterized membrane protein
MGDVAPWVAPLVAVAVIVWLGWLATAPLLPAAPAGIVYGIGSLVCHQIGDRSFHVGGYQLPVCARCLGIYAGLACGAVAAAAGPTRAGAGTRARAIVALAALPTVTTVLAEWSGLWYPSNAVRFGAGLPLGVALAVVVFAIPRSVRVHARGSA